MPALRRSGAQRARLAGLPREVPLALLGLEALVLKVQLHALRCSLALQRLQLLRAQL